MILKNKNITYVTLLLITALSSLFFYCNSSNGSKTVSAGANPYFPVNENDRWTYINQAPRDESELFETEVSDVSKNGESVTADFKSFPFFKKANTNKCTVRINKEGEVYVKDSTENEKMLLPGPSKLQKGYTWQYGGWDAAVMETNVTVKTEKKDFENCIYVDYVLGGITFSVELWLAKDTGIVKWGSNRTNPPSRSYIYYVLK